MTIHVFAAGTAVEMHAGDPPGSLPLATAAGTVVVYTGGHDVELHEAAPADDIGVLRTRPLWRGATVWFRTLHNGSGYTRNTPVAVLQRASGVNVQLAADNALMAQSYVVTCDGAPVGAVTRPAAGWARYQNVALDLSAVSDGWHLFDIVPSGSTETAVPFWMYVGAVGPQTWAPTQAGSYTIAKLGPFARWAKVPAQLNPQVAAVGYPLAPRAWSPMTGHPHLSLMYRRDLAPAINGDPPYLYKHSSGVWACVSPHAYSLGTFFAKLPTIVLRDGPRGVGTAVGLMHTQIGRRGGIYGLDSWRMLHVDPTGRVKTLLGWRHGAAGLEMVGDWSAVPAERRGLHEAWGLAWDARTVAESSLDTSVLLDRGDGTMEHPHGYVPEAMAHGPVAYIADTQNNRILRAEFSGTDHSAAPKVTEHITGLNDPWDVVFRAGLLYVSERLAHRIAVYDATTGAYVETLLQGAALSGVAKNRTVYRVATLETCRAQPVVGPEGLYLLGDWLYFGSRALEQVRRINLTTRAVEWVCDPYFDNSSNGSSFCKIAVRSDGTVFVSTWENHAKGGPQVHRPDGTKWPIQSESSSTLKGGRGGSYTDHGYSTSCAVDDYRIICAGADYGLVELSLALPTDPPAWDKALYAAGESEYEQAGYRLTHGVDGFGQFGYQLPWGKSAAMDYYLACHGHKPDGSYAA